MANRKTAVERLGHVCSALPEAQLEEVAAHVRLAVRKKTFAWLLDNHHGDGKLAVTCKVPPGENARLAEEAPERFYLPAYLAKQGWIALRLDTGRVDWALVERLVRGSYVAVAPKKLVAALSSKP